MLTPCEPICVCPDATCEQCIFGYISQEAAHNIMKKLIIETYNGELPTGWKCATKYMAEHPNWRKEMEEEVEAKQEKATEKSYVYHVSYVSTIRGSLAFSNSEVSITKEINSFKDIDEISEAIRKDRGYDSKPAILYFTLLREEN